MSRKELASWTGFYIDGNLICGPRAGYLPIPPPPAPKPEPTPEEVAAARKKAERAAKRKRAREAWREELNGGPRRPQHACATAAITLTYAAASAPSRGAVAVKTVWLDRALAAVRARGTGTPACEGTGNLPAKGVSDTKTPVPIAAAAQAAFASQAEMPLPRQAGVPVPRSAEAPDAVPSNAGKLARGFVAALRGPSTVNHKLANAPASNVDAGTSTAAALEAAAVPQAGAPTLRRTEAAPLPQAGVPVPHGPEAPCTSPLEAARDNVVALEALAPPQAGVPTPPGAATTTPAHYYILGNRIFLSAQPLGPRGRELRDAAPPPDSRPTDFTIRCGQICGPGAKGFFIRARHIYGPKGRRVPWLETAA